MELKMLYSTKIDGNMSKNYDEIEGEYLINRKKFFNDNKINIENTIAIDDMNGTNIIEIDEKFIKGNKDLSVLEIKTDCIITKIPNIFIYLPFGDCVPLAILDTKQNIFAFAHLGWRSTELNFHLIVIEMLKNKYNSRIEDMKVIIGPSIKKESYIFKEPSQLNKKEWIPFLSQLKDGYYQIDLNGYIVDGLNKVGITKIVNSEIDTAKDNSFFSHYKSIRTNEKEGRFICGAMMVEN